MLDETVETRRPWRGSPHPCVHAGVFLHFMGIISTVSKPLRYSRFGTVRVHPPVPGAYALTLWQDNECYGNTSGLGVTGIASKQYSSMYEYSYTC